MCKYECKLERNTRTHALCRWGWGVGGQLRIHCAVNRALSWWFPLYLWAFSLHLRICWLFNLRCLWLLYLGYVMPKVRASFERLGRHREWWNQAQRGPRLSKGGISLLRSWPGVEYLWVFLGMLMNWDWNCGLTWQYLGWWLGPQRWDQGARGWSHVHTHTHVCAAVLPSCTETETLSLSQGLLHL